MASHTCQPVEILPAPAFQRDIRGLRRDHRDVDALIVAALAKEVGPDPNAGWGIPGWGDRVRKLRVADGCHNRGKSKGFRLIYDWHPDTRVLWLLRLYTHAQMDDIADGEIKKVRNAVGLS